MSIINNRKELKTLRKLTLRAARVNAGLSQKEAADKLEIARSTLSRIERKNGIARVGFLEKMASVYGIRSEDFKLWKDEDSV